MDRDYPFRFNDSTIQRFNEITSLLPVFPDDVKHRLGVRRLFERLSEIGLVEKFGDVGQRVKVLLKLALRHQEQHDELYRLIVERIEAHAFLRTAQRADNFKNQIGRGMRNADAESNAGAHGSLALFDGGGHGVAIIGLDFARGDEIANQLVNRFPAILCAANQG